MAHVKMLSSYAPSLLKKAISVLIILGMLVPAFVHARQVTATPLEIDSVVFAPDLTGFVLGDPEGTFGSFPATAWFKVNKVSKIVQARVSWAYLEPSEGQYDWAAKTWETEFNTWIDNGYDVILWVCGFYTCGTLFDGGNWTGAEHGPDGTPQWVFDAGAQYIDWAPDDNVFFIGTRCGVTIREPVYWDSIYVQKACNFIKAFGARYNNNPHVIGIEMGFLGRWGEMHLDGQPFSRYTSKGYSASKFAQTHALLSDAFKTAFPDKPVIQSLSDPEGMYGGIGTGTQALTEIVADCVSKGIALKQCGFGPSDPEGYSQNEVNMRQNYVKVPCIMEYINSPWDLGDIATAQATAEKNVHATLFVNPFDISGLVSPNQNMAAGALQAARYAGYRMVLQQMQYPDTVAKGMPFTTAWTWTNKGSAPCYHDYGILLSLVNGAGATVWQAVQFPRTRTSATTAWDSNKLVNDTLQWTLPANVPGGSYQVRIGMRDMTDSTQRVELAIAGRDNQTRYTIGSTTVVAPTTSASELLPARAHQGAGDLEHGAFMLFDIRGRSVGSYTSAIQAFSKNPQLYLMITNGRHGYGTVRKIIINKNRTDRL